MEVNNQKKLDNLHSEHLRWLSDLNFYQDEIKFFQNTLLDAALHNVKNINMEKVGEYRKMLMNYLMLIDDFRFQIYAHEKVMSQKALENKESGEDHTDMRMEMEEFEKSILDLRKKFKDFIAEKI